MSDTDSTDPISAGVKRSHQVQPPKPPTLETTAKSKQPKSAPKTTQPKSKPAQPKPTPAQPEPTPPPVNTDTNTQALTVETGHGNAQAPVETDHAQASTSTSRRSEILANLKRHRHTNPAPEDDSDVEVITCDNRQSHRTKRVRPEPEDVATNHPETEVVAAHDNPSSSDYSSGSDDDSFHSDSPSDSSDSAADSDEDEEILANAATAALNHRSHRVPGSATHVAGRRRDQHRHQNRVVDPCPKKYSAKGRDPLHKLADDPKMLAQWSFSLDMKFDDDSPLFPNDSYKVRYAMTQIDSPLWENLAEWLEDRRAQDRFPSFKRFMREIGDILDVKDLASSARMELQDIRQGDMSVTDLHNKMSRLWRAAGTSRRDRIYTFRQALAPYIHDALDIYADRDFKNDRGLLKKARRIERNRRCKRHAQDRFRAKSGNDNPRKRYSGSGSGNYSGRPRSGTGTGPSAAFANTNSSGPQRPAFVSFTKPADWPGEFYKPDQYPKLLQDRDRNSLRQENRCFRCRGSGHRKEDHCCPNRPNNRDAFWGTHASANTAAPAPAANPTPQQNAAAPTETAKN